MWSPEGRNLELWLLFLLCLLLTAGWSVFATGRSEQCIWTDAPGGPLTFRLIRRAPLALLIRFLLRIRDPNWINALGCWGTVHWSHETLNRHLLAHELGHLIRARGRPTRYVLRYLLDPGFRKAEEVACEAFADEWCDSLSIGSLTRSTSSPAS